MLKNIFFLLVILSFTVSCTKNRDLEANLKKLDEVYGYCDNPQRDIRGIQYKVCKDKERAGMKSLELTNLSEIFRRGAATVAQSNVNPTLWQASLTTLNSYSLKIADSNGGYIETDWIFDEINAERCVVKVQITSPELVTTGVNTTIICQNKSGENWVNNNSKYNEEAKQITLRILNEAAKDII